MGIVEPVNVRSHKAHVVFTCDFDDLLLQSVLTHFGEAGGNQNRSRNTLLTHLHQHSGHKAGRDAEDGDVHLGRYVGDPFVALAAQNFLCPRVYGVDLPLVTAVDEILHHRVADLSLLRRRPDDRHGIGLHNPAHSPQDVLVGRPRPRLDGFETRQDAHVNGRCARAARKYRIQIHLADFRKIVHQPGDTFDHRAQGIAVHPCGAPDAAQHLGTGNVVKHSNGLFAGSGSQAESHVLDHLHHNATHAEGHELAETGVCDRADDDLVIRAQHALHLHTVDGRVRQMGSGVRHNCRVTLLHLNGRVQARKHATGVRLVENVRGGNFQNNGETDLLCQSHRFVGR